MKKQQQRIKQSTGVLLATIIMLLFTSCSKSISYNDLNTYLTNPKNGLMQSADSDKIVYVLQYIPKEYLFKGVNDKVAYQDNNLLYFKLGMSTHTNEEIVKLVKSEVEYTELLYTLHNKMHNKIEFLGTTDTLKLLSYEYPRTYGYSHATHLVLAFNEEKVLRNKKFKVRLSNLAPIDYTRIQFEFNTLDIKRLQKKLDTKLLKDE